MIKITDKLDKLLSITKEYIFKSSDTELAYKEHPEKWSKKEIIGHLIDSGINNTKRFTAALIEKEPHRIRPMKQVELVKVNDYQNAEIEELLALLISINIRIKKLILLQTAQTLNTKIESFSFFYFYTISRKFLADIISHILNSNPTMISLIWYRKLLPKIVPVV